MALVEKLKTGYSVEFFDLLGNTVAVATLPGSYLRSQIRNGNLIT
ncbi:DUF4926 domain-containing protein [Microcoleus sp. CAWBG58]|nr:DUF4926 domain-containing protein [Microcoleus sp. CAWBG58]